MNDAKLVLPDRRSIRLKEYDYRRAGAYFVTLCAATRECVFGDVFNGETRLSPTGQMVRKVWDELPSHYPGIGTDAFIIMPNHVHGIIILVGAGRLALPVDKEAVVGAGLALPAKRGAASGAPTKPGHGNAAPPERRGRSGPAWPNPAAPLCTGATPLNSLGSGAGSCLTQSGWSESPRYCPCFVS